MALPQVRWHLSPCVNNALILLTKLLLQILQGEENMKLSVVILMIAVSVNLAGCLSANPSESDAKEAVLKSYKKYIDSGDLVVENVKKTDATEMELMGVKMYEMKVDVTLKYPKGYNCEAGFDEPLFCIGKRSIGKENFAIAPGFSETVPKMVHFEKSEKGWHGKIGF